MPPLDSAEHTEHGGGFGWDDLAGGGVADRAHTAGVPAALLGALLLRTGLAHAFAFDLAARHGCFDTRVHSAAVGGKVSITVRGDEFQPLLFRPVDPLFELRGLSCEAVEVPANDRVDLAALKGRHHRVVVGTVHVLLRRGDRLIDVGMHDVPAALLGEGFAVLTLPVDGEAVHGSI